MLDDTRLTAGLATALLVLTGAGLARFAGLPRLGKALLPVALLVGFTLVIGGLQASPRQLGERLPMLALFLLGPALVAAWRPRPLLGWAMLGLAAMATGWWMSGGALHGPDLLRALPVLLAVAMAAGLAGVALRGPWQGGILPLGLAGMMAVALPPGPWFELALVLAVIGAAGMAFGRLQPMAGWIALGPAMAALAAGPVIALGRPQAWIIASGLLAAAVIAIVPLPPRARLAIPAGLLAAATAVLWLR